MPLTRYDGVLAAQTAAVEAARTEAVAARAQLAEQEAALASGELLAERRSGYVPPVALLRELTAQIPEHTWLSRLAISRGEVHLQGESAAATELLQLLESIELLRDVQFQSPVSRGDESGKEQFTIVADSRGARNEPLRERASPNARELRDPRRGALAVAFAALATPIRERAAFFASLESERTTYTKSLEALARSEAVSVQFELRQAASDPTAQTFHADTPALAGAELQNQLNALIAAEGGILLSAGFREPTSEGALTPLVVTIRLRCSMDALLRILHGLENRTPVLFVETLAVQSRQLRGHPQRQEDADLDVELDIVGFLAAQAAL